MGDPGVIVLLRWCQKLRPGADNLITSAYVETFWLPVIGPTAMCLARSTARVLGESLESVPVPGHELAMSLGTRGTGKSAPMPNAISRLRKFGFATSVEDPAPHVWLLELHPTIPDVPARFASRFFSPGLMDAHTAVVAGRSR